MLQSISIVEARNNFSDLLGEVYYGGKRFLIEKLGKPFAVLMAVDEYKKYEQIRKYFFEKIENGRQKNQKNPLAEVNKDIAEAIKFVRKRRNS